MFSDDVLEKIFARKELQSLDLSTQSSIIHAIEDVLEEVEENEHERSLSGTGIKSANSLSGIIWV